MLVVRSSHQARQQLRKQFNFAYKSDNPERANETICFELHDALRWGRFPLLGGEGQGALALN
jgi:hypothetical protein